MSHGKSDPYREQREKIEARNLDTSIPLSGPVREIEIFLLRYGAQSHSPLVEWENMMPGGGILVAYDAEGRKFKIEISQIDGRK